MLAAGLPAVFLLPTFPTDPLLKTSFTTQSVSTLLASVFPQTSLGSPDQTITGSQATHSDSSRGRVVRRWKARGVQRAGLLQVGPASSSVLHVGLISWCERRSWRGGPSFLTPPRGRSLELTFRQ